MLPSSLPENHSSSFLSPGSCILLFPLKGPLLHPVGRSLHSISSKRFPATLPLISPEYTLLSVVVYVLFPPRHYYSKANVACTLGHLPCSFQSSVANFVFLICILFPKEGFSSCLSFRPHETEVYLWPSQNSANSLTRTEWQIPWAIPRSRAQARLSINISEVKGRKAPWLVFSSPVVLSKNAQHCHLNNLEGLAWNACHFSVMQCGIQSILEAQGFHSRILGKLTAYQEALVYSNIIIGL